MPAKKIDFKPTKGRIGIIACGGDVPWHVAQACHNPFIVGLKSITDTNRIQIYDHAFFRIGAIGAIIKTLKAHGIEHICLIGSLKKPSLTSLRPDLTGLKLLKKISYNQLGDDGLLRAIRRFLEAYGFTIHGAHTLAPNLLTPEGVMTASHPRQSDEGDIALGVKKAQELGEEDQGQAVIVCKGKVIATEDREGTHAMIKANGCKNAVLVKLCKPLQDKDLDLPTIGIHTVQACIDKGFAGIAIHAGASLFVDRDESIKLANAHDLFIQGITP